MSTDHQSESAGASLPRREEDPLPDPLTMANGARVTSAAMWTRQRRPELLELFRRNIYGRMPLQPPANLKFTARAITPGMMAGQATRKQIAISYEGAGGRGEFNLLLFVPSGARKPAPAFLLINNRGAKHTDPARAERSPFWPAEELVARGYAAAVFSNAEIDPDRHDGFKNGVHGILDNYGAERPGDAWGTIAAWAWGARRAMDYLETDCDIDPKRVAVIGQSRGGKTALWAGAEDERFALVISNDSGCTGAAIARGKSGETVARINEHFPHWFCRNYHGFAGREAELPVDQHELIALIAPRRVYVASASEDAWSDPLNEFRACVHAAPVYALFGLKGLDSDAFPPVNSPMQTGSIAYHLREGKHDLTLYDWTCYLDYADKHLR